MKFGLSTLGSALALLSANYASADLSDDVSLIAEREFGIHVRSAAEQTLNDAFVEVYFRPLHDLGVTIADREKFAQLIPVSDRSPYIEDVLGRMIEAYSNGFSSGQLAELSAQMREDPTANLSDIFATQVPTQAGNIAERIYEDAIEQVASDLKGERNANPAQEALVGLLAGAQAAPEMWTDDDFLRAWGETLDSAQFAHAMVVDIGFEHLLEGFASEIRQIERPMTNPVTLAAIRTEGVLNFANRTQRQALLRQFDPAESGTGARFIRPPNDPELSE